MARGYDDAHPSRTENALDFEPARQNLSGSDGRGGNTGRTPATERRRRCDADIARRRVRQGLALARIDERRSRDRRNECPALVTLADVRLRGFSRGSRQTTATESQNRL